MIVSPAGFAQAARSVYPSMGCDDQSSRVAVEFVSKVRGKAQRPCGRWPKKTGFHFWDGWVSFARYSGSPKLKAKARASGVGILAPCFSADACLLKAPQRDLGSVGAL